MEIVLLFFYNILIINDRYKIMSLFDWTTNNLGSQNLSDKIDELNALKPRSSYTESFNHRDFESSNSYGNYKLSIKGAPYQEDITKTASSDEGK
jgi:hypothetical protein